MKTSINTHGSIRMLKNANSHHLTTPDDSVRDASGMLSAPEPKNRALTGFIVLALFCLGQPLCNAAPADLPAGLAECADAGLSRFVAELKSDELSKVGISDDKAGMGKLHLAWPFQIFEISPVRLAGNQTTASVSNITSATTLWYFPVVAGDSARAVLIVDKVGAEWKAVSLGYPRLATELKAIQNQWPDTKGFHARLVLARQPNRIFFTLPEIDDVNLTEITLVAPSGIAGPAATAVPLQKSAGAASSQYALLKSVSDVIPGLKQEMEAELKSSWSAPPAGRKTGN